MNINIYMCLSVYKQLKKDVRKLTIVNANS